MKLAVAGISFIVIMFEVLVVIMVVCCMELTSFIIFCAYDVLKAVGKWMCASFTSRFASRYYS